MKKDNMNYILEGMASLLGTFPFPQFHRGWPKVKTLPSLKEIWLNETHEDFNLGNEFFQSQNPQNQFQVRVQKKIKKCKHKERKHYAKGMCTICYYYNNKKDKVAQCGHADRVVFARNMCCSCYSSAYKTLKKKKLISKK